MIYEKPKSIIKNVEDLSDGYTQKVRVYFENGLSLSVIRGKYTYGGSKGLFEIAILDSDGSFRRDMLEPEDQVDDVLGWCSVEKVRLYIRKVGTAHLMLSSPHFSLWRRCWNVVKNKVVSLAMWLGAYN